MDRACNGNLLAKIGYAIEVGKNNNLMQKNVSVIEVGENTNHKQMLNKKSKAKKLFFLACKKLFQKKSKVHF